MFPETPILDNFNRPDEGPPPSASWESPVSVPGYELVVRSASLQSYNAPPFDVNHGGWSLWKTVYNPDQENYITLKSFIAGVAQYIWLYCRLDGIDFLNCYALEIAPNDSLFPDVNLEMVLFSVSGGSFNKISQVNIGVWGVGDSYGLQCIGQTIKALYKPFGGSWTEVISVNDGTVTGSGRLAVEMGDTSGALELIGFGGGAIPPAPIIPGKYSGKDLEVSFGRNVIPCGNVRAVNIDEKTAIEDETGACDEFMDYLDMRRDVDVSLELLDSTDPAEVYNLFTGLSDSLIIYPLGNHAGKPKLTITEFMITDLSQPIKYTDAVLVNVAGKASGGMVEGVV